MRINVWGTPTLLKWVSTLTLLTSTSFVIAADATTAVDPEAGKASSVLCAGCHGMMGAITKGLSDYYGHSHADQSLLF